MNETPVAAPFRFGVNGGLHINRRWMPQLYRDLGFEFAVVHFEGHPGPAKLADCLAWIGQIDAFCAAHDLRWHLNVELSNFQAAYLDELGRDWFNHEDGRHYFQFPPEVLTRLGQCRRFETLLYDEPEHMQNSANMFAKLPGGGAPWLYRPGTESLAQASQQFGDALERFRRQHDAFGVRLSTEHVFPVMIHSFARAGWQPIPKVLKETLSPVPMACALGAMLQYGCGFQASPDLWGDTDCQPLPRFTSTHRYPGHGPQAYWDAMLYAYHMGVSQLYTENLDMDHLKDGTGSLIAIDGETCRVTALGETTRRFIKEYVPRHPRHYDVRTVRPRVAIIRQEDGCWGQGQSWYPAHLFGNPAWTPTPATRAWIDIWHLLSVGEMKRSGLSWLAGGDYRHGEPFRFLVPVDGVVVFDEQVSAELLQSLEVIVLTGVALPAATQAAVRARVQGGATAIALPSLVPAAIRAAASAPATVPDGQGRWVIAEDFLDPLVRQALAPVLPAPDTIRYRFANTVVSLTGLAGGLRVEVQTESCP